MKRKGSKDPKGKTEAKKKQKTLDLDAAWDDMESRYDEKQRKAYAEIEDTIGKTVKTTDHCPSCKKEGHAACKVRIDLALRSHSLRGVFHHKGWYSTLTCDNGHYWWSSEDTLIDPETDRITCDKRRSIGIPTLNRIRAKQILWKIDALRAMAKDLEELLVKAK